ncbi:MAG TPA: HAMP domain-containing sensor histidine kinase, partial [Pyrinomonadaceae bacterium]|nr:HAMP domain-containing sensor histidine kinase [Pyrinomonadaceae bacterium]
MNLLLLGAILFLIFNLNFRFSPRSPFFGGSANRIGAVTRLITREMNGIPRAERDEVLKRYSDAYGVEFFLFDNRGNQLGGREITLPAEVFEKIADFETPGLERQATNSSPRSNRELPPPGPPPSIYVKTPDPPLYWLGVRTLTYEKDAIDPIRTRILAASDSFSGNGLFFDPTPWLLIVGTITVVSTIFWFPFVRGLTKNLRQMTNAAEQIADENFDVRVSDKRTDELGRLGKAINHLASRLSGFVGGQKRFLGDISHELNSPLARMQFALSILEDRVDETNRAYVEDVKEEVVLMSKLVGELLAFSKAGIKTVESSLEKVHLLPLVEAVIEREKAAENAEIKVEIPDATEVTAHPELLSRAVANVVRNAVRYAGDAGEIIISAAKEGNQVKIE